jgi:RimJ/RimL family protein N-acetyltransferase
MELPLSSCTVRSWRSSDAPDLAHAANDRSIWVNVRDRFPHPYALADAERFITLSAGTEPESSFAIDVGGRVVGAIGLILGEDIYRVSAEVGYWMAADWRGRGIAAEALRGLSAWAFPRFALVRLHAAVFTWNHASARVLEKAGFALESTARCAALKDGRIVDEWIYVRLRDG